MIGIAAVAMTAAFTSCSKDKDFEQISQVQLDESKYQAAFESRYGKINPNNDWGFGQFRKGANARMTRGENANANEWADVSNNTGFGGWLVPDPLTEGQKLRVKAYFQANPNLSYEDPHWTNFFVQQVYKGGPSTAGSNSTEQIVAADGTSKYTSDNMNHMTVGQNEVHINNFNGGDATEVDVLDNGANIKNKTGMTYHKDKIMLMVNIDDTSCFGYHDSGSSNQEASPNHNDKAALVSATTIDAWAAQNGNPGEAVTDKWNRSFLGFDLAIKEGDQTYAKDNSGNVIYADYTQAPTAPIYGWDGEKVVEMGEFETVYPDPNNQYWVEQRFKGYKPEYQNIFKGTSPIGYLTTNKNFYIAEDAVTLTGEYSNGEIEQSALNNEALANVLVFKDVKVPGAQNNKAHVINLKRIKELVDAGYLPVMNKSLKEWVKVGKSDGYFSDWIVTVTEAQKNVPLPTADVRVIVEDMQAAEEWDGVQFKGDFDFNDVVFDVVYDYDETQSAIILQAAGGTLPLYVDGHEVHEAFGVGTSDMVNTNAGPNVAPQVIPLGKLYDDANKIKVTVVKPTKDGGSVEYELEAVAGRAPHKIAVPTDFDWMTEWLDIDTKYTNFSNYIQTGNASWYKVRQ